MKKDFNGQKFVYYKDERTGRTENMNWWEWNDLQKNPNKKKFREIFTFIREVDINSPLNIKPEKLEIVDDPLECPVCGYIAEHITRLAEHKQEIHA